MKMCNRCVLDEGIPNIKFDDHDICNYCKLFDLLDHKYPNDEKGNDYLDALVKRIKRDSFGRKYDCVVGVSGGVDSSYVLYLTKQYGLRPVAVHLDNGWNTKLSESNVKTITTALNVDLETFYTNWDEFKNMQIAFLKASVPDVELLSDHAIIEVLYQAAKKHNVKYIIGGGNFRTEGIIPRGWTYMDDRYFNAIIKTYAGIKLLHYPRLTLFKKKIYYPMFKGIQNFRPLNYVNYNKEETLKLLEDKFNWEKYSGKHYESIFTRWFQSYYLPEKFGIDKRKIHFSALINSKQMSREEAFEELGRETYPKDEIIKDTEYVKEKLELSDDEFKKIINLPPRYYYNYPNNYKIVKNIRLLLGRNYDSRP